MIKKNLAQKYLQEHGINEETIEAFELSYDENYLHIPVKDEEGKDLFVKSRNLRYGDGTNKEPKYKNSQGSHATLFNLYAVADSKLIVLTEGEMDAMKLMQEGIPAISSTGGAGTFPEEFTDLLSDKKVFICYDTDEAGKKGLFTVLNLLPKARVLQLPDTVKDVCEFFQVSNKEEFLRLMKLSPTRVEYLASTIPDDYQLLTSDDMNNMQVTSMPFIIDSIIYQEGFCFIYGAEGTGKSFIALSLAISAASGNPWLDIFKVTNPTNTLYLDKENPTSRIAKRVKYLGGAPKGLFWLKSPEKFALTDSKGELSEFALALTTLVEKERIGLIVVDSFVDLMVGSENSAEETQRFFDALRQLFPRIALLVLHHENKPQPGAFRNSGQRARGSSNINAQTDTMFRLEAIAKSKTEITLEQTKNRDEEKLDKFLIRMEVGNDPEEGREGKTVVTGFSYLGIVASSSDDRNAEAEELITQTLGAQLNYSMKRKDLLAIISASGLSESTLNRTIKSMETEKTIQKVKQGKDVWFKLNDPIVDEIRPNGAFL